MTLRLPRPTRASYGFVIEDDADIRETMRLLLQDAGYTVREAANGSSRHALLRTIPEWLVGVLDHKLPALDGCELLDLVAQDDHLHSRHVFIVVTAGPTRAVEDCDEALEALDVPVVSKPFDIAVLVEAVR
jgi:CheY-like chemotaxis protein